MAPNSSGEPYYIPGAKGTPPMNVVPTDTLLELQRALDRYAEALIEIGAAFDSQYGIGWCTTWCSYCGHGMDDEEGCSADCPGLLARRALGVA